MLCNCPSDLVISTVSAEIVKTGIWIFRNTQTDANEAGSIHREKKKMYLEYPRAPIEECDVFLSTNEFYEARAD